jgi:hypothetical protein
MGSDGRDCDWMRLRALARGDRVYADYAMRGIIGVIGNAT